MAKRQRAAFLLVEVPKPGISWDDFYEYRFLRDYRIEIPTS